MNHLGEEDGLDVFLFIEHVHAREDGGILERGEALFVSCGDIRRGRRSGSE